MAKHKYLCFISYLGLQSVLRAQQNAYIPINHRFVLRNIKKYLHIRFGKQVQSIGDIEIATRHEKGVHAPGNAVCFELEQPSDKPDPIEPQALMDSMNFGLLNRFNNLMFSSCQLVPTEFSCRDHAVAREFIYRLALPKLELDRSPGLESYLPIGELYRCGYLTNPEKVQFDLSMAEDLVSKMKGRHNFASFCSSTVSESPTAKLDTTAVIDEFEVNKVDLATHQEFDMNYKNLDIYEFYIRGRWFLSGQLPRMISAITTSAIGLDSRHLIQDLLTKSRTDYHPQVHLPNHGLYLIGIHYDDQDLKFGETRVVPTLPPGDFDADLATGQSVYDEFDEVDESEIPQKVDIR